MPFRTISVALTGNTGDLSSALRSAAREVDRFDTGTRRSSQNVTQSTGLMTRSFQGLDNIISRGVTRSMVGFTAAAFGGYQAGRALNAALQQVIGGAVQFDARMRNVNSISGLTEAQLGLLGNQVLDLSRTLPQSANNLAEGLYDIASSGFQGAAGVTVLAASAKAATAGLTDTATAAQAIAGVLNAYGEGAANAQYVSDSLFQTVNLGVLSFSDLAQGIGQVVGTAAAASVSVDEVGQAIATLTKGGIVPAESFTSLNQLLAQIIQPGEALAAVFQRLGYESGAAALKSKGLQGVMGDIQRVTGGDVTTLSQLFTDIRSLRGALTLTANQGQLYAGVVDQWSTAHKGAGATATALAEQMKSVSAQWSLFKNRAQAAAIEAGTRLLPTILSLLSGVEKLANEGMGALQEATDRLGPFFRGIRDIGADLSNIFGDLVDAASPLAKALLGIAGGAIITTLNALATALAAVFNFVDSNRTTFEVLAGVIAALLLPSMVSLTVAFNRLVLTPIVYALVTPFLALARATGLAGAAATGATAKFAALATVEGAVTLGLTAIAVAGAVGMYRVQKATAEAHREVDAFMKGFDANNMRRATATVDILNDKIVSVGENLQTYNHGASKFIGGLGELGIGPLTDDIANLHTYEAAADAAADAIVNTYVNSAKLGTQVGLSAAEVRKFAAANNIDLSAPWAASGDALDQVREGLAAVAAQAGVSLPALKDLAGEDVTAMQDLAKAVSDAQKQVAATFASATDVISIFDPAAAAQSVADAQKSVTDAEQRLADLRAQQAANDKTSVTDSQALASARQDVADATSKLADAQATASRTGTLEGVYRSEIGAGQEFVQNLRTVLERGLDPELVSRLLQAGPEKAAPVLQQLVADHSGRLIEMANKSEQTLRRIDARIVELTRLTTLAVQSQTDRLTSDLPRAVKLEQELARQGAKATLDSLTEGLHLSESQINRIATEFGITLPRAVQRELDAHPVHVRVSNRDVPIHDSHRVGGFATGGLATGPGTGTSDSILARVSNGEYIVRASVVAQPGMLAYLNQINRFADGGYVGRAPAGGSTIVRISEQPAQYVTKTEVNVGQVRAHDYHDFRAQMDEEARARATMP